MNEMLNLRAGNLNLGVFIIGRIKIIHSEVRLLSSTIQVDKVLAFVATICSIFGLYFFPTELTIHLVAYKINPITKIGEAKIMKAVSKCPQS